MLDEVPFRAVRPVAGFLQGQGADAGGILRAVGIDATRILDPAARLPYERWIALWRRIELDVRNPAMGLHIAALTDFSVFRMLEYETEYTLAQLVASSATIGDALERLVRFFPIGWGATRFEVRRGTDVVLRVVFPSSVTAPRTLAEYMIGIVVNVLRDLASPPVKPLAVRFAHPAPADLGEHRRRLGDRLVFDAADHAIVVAPDALAVRLSTARPELAATLERRAETMLAELRPPLSLIDSVRGLLTARIEHRGDESVDAIARALGTSVRTLTRRLAEHGTSHRELLSAVRVELAERYLAEPGITVREVARRLGFADASAFHRAFRRWTGRSPSELRVPRASSDP
jgi:AraC-like DNA-binding protein